MRILPRLQLFRALFPSWRFFDRPGAPYLLEVCWNPESHEHWEKIWVQEPVLASQLFLNPRGNLAMAWQSLVETLASELEEATEGFPAQSVSYALVKNGVEALSGGRSYRFRILCDGEVLLLSPRLSSSRVTP